MSRHTASRSGLRRTEVADIHALDEVSFCAPHDPSRTPEHVRRVRGRLRAPCRGFVDALPGTAAFCPAPKANGLQ